MKTTNLYTFFFLNLHKGATMGKMLKTSPAGRKCIFPECNQILSIYNHEVFCHIHRDLMSIHPIYPGQTPEEKKTKILTYK